jgi:uncharacterized protein YndB with AHSA1/START domain
MAGPEEHDMAHRFEITKDIEVEASPEQVWEAITTGPGMDSWFLGRNEIEPRQGGTGRWSIGGYTLESTVTTWDPPNRFVNTGSEAADGSFHQFDYRIEERGGRTEIRYVHSGMLGGDWEAEYEGMSEGDPMYLHKLVQYLTYFSGRYAVPVDAQGPRVPDREHAMRVFRRGLGLPDDVAEGLHVRLTPDGLDPIDGVVDYVSPHFMGVRSSDALYRFIHGFDGTTMVGHHLFAGDVDQQAAERAWRSWLDGLFGPPAGTTSSS